MKVKALDRMLGDPATNSLRLKKEESIESSIFRLTPRWKDQGLLQDACPLDQLMMDSPLISKTLFTQWKFLAR